MRFGGPTIAKAQTDDPVNRETHDFYPTWPAATRALLSVERFDGAIWEPACGDGAMSRVLEAAGHEVISTDLIDRGYGEGGRDFLMEWQPRAPNIVTNPPFRWAVEFTDRALQLTTRKVALFLRLAFLEGQDRGEWFPTTPLARVWVMSRRVPIQRGRMATGQEEKGGVLAFAWFVWEHGHKGRPEIGFLDWKQAMRSADIEIRCGALEARESAPRRSPPGTAAETTLPPPPIFLEAAE